MKEEIKEILDKFDKVLENYELDKKWGQMSIDSICHLFPSEMVAIKDCITNLQKENKVQKEKIEHLLIDLRGESEYKQRNEKAINILELSGQNKGICTRPETDTIQSALIILRGGEE